MSLLMDARKKSQQAQLVQEDGRAAQTGELSLEECPKTAAAESAQQSGHLARSAGQNLFAAKSAVPPVPYKGVNRNLLFVLSGTILLLAGAAGYLLYLDSNSNTKPLHPAGLPHAAQTLQPIPPHATPEAASQNTLVPGIDAPDFAGNPQKTSLASVALHVEDAHPLRQADATTGETTSHSTRLSKNDSQVAGYGETTSHSTRLSKNDSQVIGYSHSTRLPKNDIQVAGYQGERSMPQPYKSSPISIGQQQAEPVDPLLRDAYLAYQSGKLDESRQLYLAMLRKDAHNLDVLLGLAAIAQQRGENLMAVQYFSRVLALDPRNAPANAGISSLSTDDDNSESRLKTLLREQGSSAVLHFALGNIYAEQSRWSEAQQAYFNAYMLESGNAGFAFNLAVSLEHLGQNKLAAQHYQRALELDQQHSAGFDHAQISQHIEELVRDENAD